MANNKNALIFNIGDHVLCYTPHHASKTEKGKFQLLWKRPFNVEEVITNSLIHLSWRGRGSSTLINTSHLQKYYDPIIDLPDSLPWPYDPEPETGWDNCGEENFLQDASSNTEEQHTPENLNDEDSDGDDVAFHDDDWDITKISDEVNMRKPLYMTADVLSIPKDVHITSKGNCKRCQPGDTDIDFEVEDIMDDRHNGQYQWYKICWVGYSPEFDSWSCTKHMNGCIELIKEYNDYKSQSSQKKERVAAIRPPLLPPWNQLRMQQFLACHQ